MKKLKGGWVEGSVQEFLSLSDADMEYIETKLALSRRLRELRAKKDLTQTELAAALKTSQSRVAKMEKGDPTVSVDLLLQALFRLGFSRKELARQTGIAEKALHRMLSRRGNPTARTLAKIVAAIREDLGFIPRVSVATA